MATATKIKKIIEVELINGLELAEVEVDVMPNNVFFISKARGVLKFAKPKKPGMRFGRSIRLMLKQKQQKRLKKLPKRRQK